MLDHPYLRHLRLGFNVLLSPIYLWGVLLSGAGPTDGRVWLGYLSVHLFLYGGTTAFNSYFDRDEGPIGGMRVPPPVDAGLLPFSLGVQALGLPLAWLVGAPFALAWLALFAVFTAYSHPAVRLKARPGAALAAIAVGQGGLGFALGWLAGAPPAGLLAPRSLLAMAAAALVVSGLYLVSQSYQTREDRVRGDRTLPVLWGPGRALGAAVASMAAGAVPLALEVARLGGAVAAAALAVPLLGVGAWTVRWAWTFDEARLDANFATAMAIVRLASVSTAAVLLVLLLRGA